MKVTKSTSMWTPGMDEPIEIPLEMEMNKYDLYFYEKLLQGWTPTAIELWNDKKFIEKRIKEQEDYLWESNYNPYVKNQDDYIVSALSQLVMLKSRLKELNGDVVELVHTPS